MGFEFDAGFAGDQVAFAHAVGAEGVAGDFHVGLLRGLIVHQGEAAFLEDQAQLGFGGGVNHRLAEVALADLDRDGGQRFAAD